MNLFSIFLALSAGICLSSGLKFIVIGFGLERKTKIHYYFSFMCIIFSLYFLVSLQLFELISSNQFDQFIQVIKWAQFLFYFAITSQLLFINEYTESPINPLVPIIVGFYFIIALSTVLLPINWLFTDIQIINGNASLILSPLYITQSFTAITLYAVFTGFHTYKYYTTGKKQPATFLGIAEGIFLISFISDFFLINLNITSYFIFAHIGLTTFVLIISLFQGYTIKLSEKELERTTELVREITRQTGEGITLANSDGKYIFTNQAYCAMTGHTEQEILQMSIHDFVPKETKPELFHKVKNRKKGVREVELLKKDGSRYLAEISGFPVILNNKNYILGVVRDITTKRKQELRMEEMAKMETIGRLAGGVAHDFNNILGGIIGYSQLIESTLDSNSEASAYIEKITKASYRGKNLVNQILVYSRKNPEDQKPIMMGPVVKEALDFLKASLPSTIEINAQIENETKPVLINETRIHEVVLNLMTNAADAIKDIGRINIFVSEVQVLEPIIGRHEIVNPGFYSVLRIEDNGSGMSETILENIFHPFFSTKRKGTGMGLAVVKSIIHNSNGEILVQSEVGKGSVFTVYLPKTDQEVEQEKVSDCSIPTGNERILYIDDEEILLESLTRIMQNLGYTVTCHLDSKMALEYFEKENSAIDLIITDQTMPNITGFELSKKFLKIKPEIPIILITGFSKDLTKEIVLDSGIRKYLKKPFDTRKLAIAIREALNKKWEKIST